VILAGCGLLALVHHDAQAFAERLVLHLHLNPARHYPRIFIEAAAHLTDSRLRLLAGGAFGYSELSRDGGPRPVASDSARTGVERV